MREIIKDWYFRRAITVLVIVLVVYALTFRFFAMYGLILSFVILGMAVIYFVVLIESVALWIRRRKQIDYPFVPFVTYIAAALTIYFLPSMNRNKSYPKSSFNLKDDKPNGCNVKLYRESYCVYSQGAWGSDLNAYYLTDSVNFRKYIGTADEEDGRITVQCKGDSIWVETAEKDEAISYTYNGDTAKTKGSTGFKYDPFKTVSKEVYSLKELKQHHVFD